MLFLTGIKCRELADRPLLIGQLSVYLNYEWYAPPLGQSIDSTEPYYLWSKVADRFFLMGGLRLGTKLVEAFVIKSLSEA